jgi:hypothetical protein
MIRVYPISSLSVTCSDDGWAFSRENRSRIASYWAETVAAKPTLWNGEVLLSVHAEVEGDHFTARLVKTDYASFVAWRDWGRPDQSVQNLFGVSAAFSSDGALVFGVMSDWTLNAGKSYPPSGTLEPKDVRPDGSVDVMASMRNELLEETGLDIAHATPRHMAAIFEGPRLAIAQRHDFRWSFAEIERRFALHTAAEDKPELARIEAIRSSSQIDSRMPPYAQEMVRYFVG